MNWLKTLWNWFTTPITDSCCDVSLTPATPVEERSPAGPLFYQVCRESGMRHKIIAQNEIVEKFEVWYNGAIGVAEIKQSIDAFKEAHPELAFCTRPLKS